MTQKAKLLLVSKSRQSKLDTKLSDAFVISNGDVLHVLWYFNSENLVFLFAMLVKNYPNMRWLDGIGSFKSVCKPRSSSFEKVFCLQNPGIHGDFGVIFLDSLPWCPSRSCLPNIMSVLVYKYSIKQPCVPYLGNLGKIWDNYARSSKTLARFPSTSNSSRRVLVHLYNFIEKVKKFLVKGSTVHLTCVLSCDRRLIDERSRN